MIGQTAWMQRWFTAFWACYALLSLAGLLLIVYYLSGARIDLVSLVKIPQVGCVLILAAFHLRYRLRTPAISVLLWLGAVQALLIGAWSGTLFTDAAVTHLYMIVMPLLAISFGIYLGREWSHKTTVIVGRAMHGIFGVSVASILLYAWFYYVTKQIAYYGFDSLLPIPAIWFLSRRQYGRYMLCLLVVLISGKRAPLLTMAAPLVAQGMHSFTTFRVSRLISLATLTIVLAGLLLAAGRAGMLSRFEGLWSVDLTDRDALYVVTSGRSHEIAGLVDTLRKEPARVWVGAGIGGSFERADSHFQEPEAASTAHYLHMSLLTHVLVFGTPFVAAFLLMLGWVLWSVRGKLHAFPVMALITSFVWSFFGAGLVVDPLFWLLLGWCSWLARMPR